MKLQNLVEQLSKSSLNSVFTVNSSSSSESSVNDYLYLETEIESDFIKLIESSRSNKKVIFFEEVVGMVSLFSRRFNLIGWFVWSIKDTSGMVLNLQESFEKDLA